MTTAFDPQVVLRQPLLANLATVSDQGPRNSPMWFLWESDALWMLGDKGSSSINRLTENSSCAVEVVDFQIDAGVLLHVGLRGYATVEPMNQALFRKLLCKYLGPDELTWNAWFIENIARIDDPDGRLIRLKPDTIFTNDASYFKTGPDLARP